MYSPPLAVGRGGLGGKDTLEAKKTPHPPAPPHTRSASTLLVGEGGTAPTLAAMPIKSRGRSGDAAASKHERQRVMDGELSPDVCRLWDGRR